MSKTLVITGLAQETDFDNPAQPRSVLVINNGELRIPIDESAVERILKHVLEGRMEYQEEVDAWKKEAEETQQAEEQHSDEEPQEEEEEDMVPTHDDVVDPESGIAQL